MLMHLDSLYSQSHVGFRRQNLPSLLAKYFYDIRSVFESIHELVKDNAPVFFVVGSNHTITSEGRFEIDTVKHIAQIAKACGLILVDQVSMDMLVSRDVFKKNAVASEVILFFRNKL
jgi:site-specific DNA-methyltransferase (cytosine-N4-specific)